MFERFTEKARMTVVLAREEAQLFNHSYIGTEHVLLGLVRESEGVAARVLSNLDADSVRREIVMRLGGGPSSGPEEAPLSEDGTPESGRHQLIFRGQVLAFEVWMRYGTLGETVVPQTPQTVSVELDYVYEAQKNGDALLGTVDPSDVREGVARVLARVGEYVLQEFETVPEITVSGTFRR